jgi:hypothetical protein
MEIKMTPGLGRQPFIRQVKNETLSRFILRDLWGESRQKPFTPAGTTRDVYLKTAFKRNVASRSVTGSGDSSKKT